MLNLADGARPGSPHQKQLLIADGDGRTGEGDRPRSLEMAEGSAVSKAKPLTEKPGAPPSWAWLCLFVSRYVPTGAVALPMPEVAPVMMAVLPDSFIILLI